ncbi:GHMP kinase [candidate division KSB1 bacterium]|nr:GHMP kinase [candidate division KSB1 bacterium]
MELKKKRQVLYPDDLLEYKSKVKLWFGGLFAPEREIFIARAPARLDVMGGIADYSGSVVLQGTLNEAAIVGIQRRRDKRLLVKSTGIEKEGLQTIINYHLDEFYESGKLKSFETIKNDFKKDPQCSWVAYVLGAFPVLLKEKIINNFASGATICIKSNIPIGAGVASSAALEVATMLALKFAYDLSFDAFQMSKYCQMVENFIVGAPCGIMDQMASSMGKQNRLLALRCQPHELLKMVVIPSNIQLIGIHSRVKHHIGGSLYSQTRVATFMGKKIIFSYLKEKSIHNPYNDYLCNVSTEEWTEKYKSVVPEQIRGDEFIEKYETHEDPATKIEPGKTYYPQKTAEHPVFENFRNQKFIKLLETYFPGDSKENLIQAGNLMYESHDSYSDNCGLGAKETDIIVNLVKKLGPEKGFYGAKITGGGSGGTVAILADKNVDDTLKNIATRYHDMTKLKPYIFWGSSPGALELGTIVTKFE